MTCRTRSENESFLRRERTYSLNPVSCNSATHKFSKEKSWKNLDTQFPQYSQYPDNMHGAGCLQVYSVLLTLLLNSANRPESGRIRAKIRLVTLTYLIKTLTLFNLASKSRFYYIRHFGPIFRTENPVDVSTLIF